MATPRTPRPEAQQAPRRVRADGWTLPRQRLFLKMLSATGSVDRAAEAAGMSRSSAYRLRLHPDGRHFSEAWATALTASVTTLREAAIDRALNGVEEAVWHNGRLLGHRHVFNDRLLMFVLRAYDEQGLARAGRLKPLSSPQDRLIASFDALCPADEPEPENVFAGAADGGDAAAAGESREVST